MATNLILETPSLPKSPIISASVSVSSLEDYPFRWDSSLLGSTSDFDRISEISSLLTSPRISFSHDFCHEDNKSSVPSVEDYQSDSLFLGFGSGIDLISENPSFPTTPRISFSHDLCNEDRSVPSVEDYQSDSLLLGFGSDIDLVSENSMFASTRSSESPNIYSVSSLDYYSCSSDFDLISETWVSHCVCCSDSDFGFDFCTGNDTAKEHCSSELIPLSGGVELERQKNESESLRHGKDSHKKRSLVSSLPVLLRSYSTGSLLGCKSKTLLAEFNF